MAEMPPLVPWVARLTDAEAGVLSLGGRAGHQGCGRLGAGRRCRGESGLGEARLVSGSTAGPGAPANTVSSQYRPPSAGLGAAWSSVTALLPGPGPRGCWRLLPQAGWLGSLGSASVSCSPVIIACAGTRSGH